MHYVLISPSMLATILSACVSSALYVVWEPVMKPAMGEWFKDALGAGGGLLGALSNSTQVDL